MPLDFLRFIGCVAAGLLLTVADVSAATYYVSPTGNDGSTGTSTSTPWRTITRVNSAMLRAGDAVKFLGGATFSGALAFDRNECGTTASPITLTSYGTGRATLTATNQSGIFVYNCGGFTIRSLNLVGSGADTAANRHASGIDIFTDRTDTKLDRIFLEYLDVRGFGRGVKLGGWGQHLAGYRNVRIYRVTAHDNLKDGILTYGERPNTHEGVAVTYSTAYNNFGVPGESSPTGSGIVLGSVNGGKVERCLAYRNGGRDNAQVGPVGIWTYDSTNVVIQFNESFDNHSGGPADGDGFDLDLNTSKSILQYNYSHGNDGAGYLLAHPLNTFTHTGNIVRYNISENDARKFPYGGIQIWGRVLNAHVYNNVVFMTPKAASPHPRGLLLHNAAIPSQDVNGVYVRNNVLITTGGVRLLEVTSGQLNGGANIAFQGNNYYASGNAFSMTWGGSTYSSLSAWRSATGQERVGSGDTGTSANPQLTNPGAGGTLGNPDLLPNVAAYKLKATSPLINAGLNLVATFGLYTALHPGSRDGYGNQIPQSGLYDIGAHEFPTPAGIFNVMINFQTATAAVPSGFVADSGAAHGDRGNGYRYGWNAMNSHSFNRNASASPDQRYDTLLEMQNGGTFTWELSVPNDDYLVRIVAGDPTVYSGTYKIQAENVLVVNGTPTSAARWVEGTAAVRVTDGRLTLRSASGAVNNKLCFVQVSAAP